MKANIEINTRPMIRTVIRIGDSIGVVIPKPIAEFIGVSPGDQVAVVVLPLNSADNGGDDENIIG